MRRNRWLAFAIVGGFVALLRALAPAPAERETWLYLVALPLGYGHLIGAAVFGRRQRWSRGASASSRALATAFCGSSLVTLLALYAWALGDARLQPLVLIPLLVLSAWHIVENDLALGRAYRNGLRLGGI